MKTAKGQPKEIKRVSKWVPVALKRENRRCQILPREVLLRFLIGSFAIVLLWSTSFSNANDLSRLAILAPSWREFIHLFQSSFSDVRPYHVQLDACKTSQLSECNESFQLAFSLEWNRLIDAQKNNKEALYQASRQIDQCKLYGDRLLKLGNFSRSCNGSLIPELALAVIIKNFTESLTNLMSNSIVDEITSAAKSSIKNSFIGVMVESVNRLNASISETLESTKLKNLSECFSSPNECQQLSFLQDIETSIKAMNQSIQTLQSASRSIIKSVENSNGDIAMSSGLIASLVSNGVQIEKIPTLAEIPFNTSDYLQSSIEFTQQLKLFAQNNQLANEQTSMAIEHFSNDLGQQFSRLVSNETIVDKVATRQMIHYMAYTHNERWLEEGNLIVSDQYMRYLTDNTSVYQATPTSIGVLSTSFESIDMSQDWGSLDLPLDLVSNLSMLLFNIDFIFRAYQTVKIIAALWNKTFTGFSTLDVRSNAQQQEIWNYVMQLSRQGTENLILNLIASPIVHALIYFIFGSLISLSILRIYSKWYQDFHHGCVNSSNGTSFSKIVYTLMTSYVGNNYQNSVLKSLQAYDTHNLIQCSSASNAIQKAQREFEVNRTTLNRQYSYISNRALIIEKCTINNDWNDSNEVCSNHHLLDSNVISNLQFSCASFPTCNITCGQNFYSNVSQQVYQNGCKVEKAIHANLLQIFLTILIFVCINISRTILIRAICIAYWKVLNDNHFTYKAYCDVQGKPEAMNQLPKAVQVLLQKRKWYIYYLLFVTLMVNVLWIVGHLAIQSLNFTIRQV